MRRDARLLLGRPAPMLWAPPAVISVASAGVAYVTSMGERTAHANEGPVLPGMWELVMVLPLAAIVVTGMVFVLRLLYLIPRAPAVRAARAVGPLPGDSWRSEAVRGALVGAVASASGAALGLVAAQLAGAEWGSLSGTTLTITALWFVVSVGACAIACDLAWRIAMTDATVADPSHAARGRRLVRRTLPWLVAPSLLGASAMTLWIMDPDPVPLILVAGLSYLVSQAELGIGAVIAASATAVWLSRAASGIVIHWGAAGRIAADALRRRTRGSTAALAGVVLAMGGAAAVAPLVMGMDARNLAMDALGPDAVITTTDAAPLVTHESRPEAPLGWAPVALPASVVAALEGDERLVVIPAAVLRVNLSGGLGQTDLFAVDPAALRAVTADAGGLALDGDSAWLGSSGKYNLSDGTSLAAASGVHGPQPFNAVDMTWAREHFGPAPTSAVLVYFTGAITADQFMADYGDVVPAPTVILSNDFTSQVDRPSYLITTAGLTGMALAVVVIFSRTGLRLRAHDYATLAALGATRRVVVGAMAIETALMSLMSALVGLFGGLVAGTAFGVSTYGLPPRLWLASAWFSLAHVPVAAFVMLAGMASLAAAMGSALWGVTLGRDTPVEQLRIAIKESAQ